MSSSTACGLGPLVHAVERVAATRSEKRTDALVRQDHQLLDEHVRVRLALQPRIGDAAVAVEAERRLRRLHLERAAREPPLAQVTGDFVVQGERLENRRRRLTALRLAVRESCVGANHRAVELGRAAVRRQLDRDAEAILIRSQRARIVGERVRKHRRDLSRHVGRERTQRRAVVERRPGAHEVRDVCDVNPRANPVGFPAKRQRIVKVLRGIGVDGVGEQVPQVDTVRGVDLRKLLSLEGRARAAFDEQRLEHVLDVIGRADHLLHPRAAATGPHDCEIARRDLSVALHVELNRDTRREIRVACDEPPAAANFDDQP